MSFGSFLDETNSLADLILPDHAPLESWLDDVPESGAAGMVASLAAPAVHPLHDTRAMPDVLLDLARGLGGNIAAAVPYKTYDEMLRAAFVPLRKRPGGSITGVDNDDDFWDKVQDAGRLVDCVAASVQAARPAAPSPAPASPPAKLADPQFDGDAAVYPFYFLPYASQAFRDGSLANLPWLQEMPDVLTTAMWSSWIELNPKTARAIGRRPGRSGGDCLAARKTECSRHALARHRSGHDRHAHRARTPELRQIRKRPRREPVLDPCVAHRCRKPARWPGPLRASS